MKTSVGLWIDHRKAVIVFATNNEEEIKLIHSEFEKPQQSPTDDVRQRELTEHLNQYYDEVISSLRKAEALLIMGPGEAKGELKKRLEKNNHNGCEVEVETADKMTDRQIVAKVRAHFSKQG
jgi:stalled ribosome rescue protein Dom34